MAASLTTPYCHECGDGIAIDAPGAAFGRLPFPALLAEWYRLTLKGTAASRFTRRLQNRSQAQDGDVDHAAGRSNTPAQEPSVNLSPEQDLTNKT